MNVKAMQWLPILSSLTLVLSCDVECLRHSDCGTIGVCGAGVCSLQTVSDGGITRPVVVEPGSPDNSMLTNNGAGGAGNLPAAPGTTDATDAGIASTLTSDILDASRP